MTQTIPETVAIPKDEEHSGAESNNAAPNSNTSQYRLSKRVSVTIDKETEAYSLSVDNEPLDNHTYQEFLKIYRSGFWDYSIISPNKITPQNQHSKISKALNEIYSVIYPEQSSNSDDVISENATTASAESDNSDTDATESVLTGQNFIQLEKLDHIALKDTEDPNFAGINLLIDQFPELIVPLDFIADMAEHLNEISEAVGVLNYNYHSNYNAQVEMGVKHALQEKYTQTQKLIYDNKVSYINTLGNSYSPDDISWANKIDWEGLDYYFEHYGSFSTDSTKYWVDLLERGLAHHKQHNPDENREEETCEECGNYRDDCPCDRDWENHEIESYIDNQYTDADYEIRRIFGEIREITP